MHGHYTGMTGYAAGRAVLATLLAFTLAGCGGGSGDDDDGGGGATRGYTMGFFFTAPEPDTDLLLATVEASSAVADVSLMQEAPPWSDLLDASGDPVADTDAVIEAKVLEKLSVRDFVEGLGMEFVYLVDPLNGVNRREEAPDLTDQGGASILDDPIRALHDEWVLAIAETVQPRWLGLASEINTLGQHVEDPILYDELVDMVNELAPQIRALSPDTRVFVSFQVEDAHGIIIPSDGEGFDLIDDFPEIDVLGLSSYPVFEFETPADIPDDHLARFAEETDLPLIMVEGGWSSADAMQFDADPEEQIDYIERYAGLLDGAGVEMWVMLLYADIDAAAFGLEGRDLDTLTNFERMGITDEGLNPKASFDAWEAIHERPLAD